MPNKTTAKKCTEQAKADTATAANITEDIYRTGGKFEADAIISDFYGRTDKHEREAIHKITQISFDYCKDSGYLASDKRAIKTAINSVLKEMRKAQNEQA